MIEERPHKRQVAQPCHPVDLHRDQLASSFIPPTRIIFHCGLRVRWFLSTLCLFFLNFFPLSSVHFSVFLYLSVRVCEFQGLIPRFHAIKGSVYQPVCRWGALLGLMQVLDPLVAVDGGCQRSDSGRNTEPPLSHSASSHKTLFALVLCYSNVHNN